MHEPWDRLAKMSEEELGREAVTFLRMLTSLSDEESQQLIGHVLQVVDLVARDADTTSQKLIQSAVGLFKGEKPSITINPPPIVPAGSHKRFPVTLPPNVKQELGSKALAVLKDDDGYELVLLPAENWNQVLRGGQSEQLLPGVAELLQSQTGLSEQLKALVGAMGKQVEERPRKVVFKRTDGGVIEEAELE